MNTQWRTGSSRYRDAVADHFGDPYYESLADRIRKKNEEAKEESERLATIAENGGTDTDLQRMKEAEWSAKGSATGSGVGAGVATALAIGTGGAALPYAPAIMSAGDKLGGYTGKFLAQDNFLGSGDNNDLLRDAGWMLGPAALPLYTDQLRKIAKDPLGRAAVGAKKMNDNVKKVGHSISKAWKRAF
jgi:hypothetical protein